MMLEKNTEFHIPLVLFRISAVEKTGQIVILG